MLKRKNKIKKDFACDFGKDWQSDGTMNAEQLREKYRLEWENLVISYINQGMGKEEAKLNADVCLDDKYSWGVEEN